VRFRQVDSEQAFDDLSQAGQALADMTVSARWPATDRPMALSDTAIRSAKPGVKHVRLFGGRGLYV
jgi:hypothetical protein